jgi:Insect cuticle protein
VLISLCVAGLTVAAPQLDLPGVQRTVTTVAAINDVNEENLVNDVVSALEPSIALAVANALRSLQSSTTTTTITEGAQVSGGGASSSGQSAVSSVSSSASAAKSSSSASKSSSSFSASAAAEKAAFEKEFAAKQANEEPTTRPEYNFEFKVADSDEQTYITQQEARDGDQLTGTYSYVDPEGALITVNYQAGPDGFSQTTDKKEGFIQIVPKPPRIAAATASGASSASASKFTSATSGASSAGGASFSSQKGSTTVSSSSSIDQSALISQILAALQPQIAASVNAAITSSQSRTTSSVIAVPAAAPVVAAAPVAVAARPVQAAASAASGNLASLFGDGYAVRIATPEFKIEY